MATIPLYNRRVAAQPQGMAQVSVGEVTSAESKLDAIESASLEKISKAGMGIAQVSADYLEKKKQQNDSVLSTKYTASWKLEKAEIEQKELEAKQEGRAVTREEYDEISQKYDTAREEYISGMSSDISSNYRAQYDESTKLRGIAYDAVFDAKEVEAKAADFQASLENLVVSGSYEEAHESNDEARKWIGDDQWLANRGMIENGKAAYKKQMEKMPHDLMLREFQQFVESDPDSAKELLGDMKKAQEAFPLLDMKELRVEESRANKLIERRFAQASESLWDADSDYWNLSAPERIKRLDELRGSGLITGEFYEAERRRAENQVVRFRDMTGDKISKYLDFQSQMFVAGNNATQLQKILERASASGIADDAVSNLYGLATQLQDPTSKFYTDAYKYSNDVIRGYFDSMYVLPQPGWAEKNLPKIMGGKFKDYDAYVSYVENQAEVEAQQMMKQWLREEGGMKPVDEIRQKANEIMGMIQKKYPIDVQWGIVEDVQDVESMDAISAPIDESLDIDAALGY
jgi:hypothetical protein